MTDEVYEPSAVCVCGYCSARRGWSWGVGVLKPKHSGFKVQSVSKCGRTKLAVSDLRSGRGP